MLFDSPIVAFSFRDMSLRGTVLHVDMHLILDRVHDWSKFIVTIDLVNTESIVVVQPKDFIKSAVEISMCPVGRN